MNGKLFSGALLEWYAGNKRDLPWRKDANPYPVWLSEVILQQTRIDQGLPYYQTFIKRFPTVRHLAGASEQEVLRVWQGLGYYSRARNMHRCARTIVKEYNGVFPDTFDALRKLPGIGDYTAAAIASITAGQPVAVVDGNVYRVLSRVFGIQTPINTTAGKKEFAALAASLVPSHEPGTYNQAVMEFGALHCKPRQPLCDSCVLARRCVARQKEMQHLLPAKVPRKPVRTRYFYYLVLRSGRNLVMKKRGDTDIWSGLYDFLLLEKNKEISSSSVISQLKRTMSVAVSKPALISPRYKHQLTHQLIYTTFIVADLPDKELNMLNGTYRLYSAKNIARLPKPVLISRFLDDYQLL